ncbi:hypothetical protein LCGC14_0821370 [marine sediment metagenome]|uniref:DNA methylase N-4/N-6 domain-containing protein n=1 Tax=marine sediment metagenome TaxID=412755 RepID=A0A0F9PNE8_9ZZZZ
MSGADGMKFSREWAMPSHETFSIPPIAVFIDKYLRASTVSIDPFARDFTRATYTNDLNPDTLASSHVDSLDFLRGLDDSGVLADLIIFDPPYSPRQVKECYNGIGLKMKQEDAQRTCSWVREKEIIHDLLEVGGVFLYFGWDSMGMGRTRGYQIEEILLVCHGPGHNDTICMAERKLQHQESFRMVPEGRTLP